MKLPARFLRTGARGVLAILPSVLALLSATLTAAILLAAFGHSPVQAFRHLIAGAVGDRYAMAESLLKTVPLLFTGISVVLAFRGSIWNIGADGQFLAGALAAGALGTHAPVRHPVLFFPLVFSTAFVAGGLWGLLAAWLRERRGVSEVISTIMLNFIALLLLSYAVHGPLQEAARYYPQSDRIGEFATLARIIPGTRLHSGFVLAVATCILAWVLLFKTPFGFRLRAVGANRDAARAAGIRISRQVLAAMTLCGGAAALGGAVEVLGVTHRLFENLSPGYGFTAIAVALLARLHPLGLLPASFLFGALSTGTRAMERALGISSVLALVMQALVILFVVLYETRWFRSKIRLFRGFANG